MRVNKKSFILILFVTLVISIIGITKSLAAEIAFKLTNVEIKDKSETVNAEIIDYDSDDININSTFHKVDDFVSYKLVIKNTTSKDYKIKNIAVNNTNPYLEYTYDTLENKNVKPNEELEIVVKATYKNEVEDINKRDSNETFKLIIDYADESDNSETENITINPRTNDKIMVFVLLGIISLTGLTILIFKNKTTKKIVVIVILLTPFIVYAFSSNVTFKFDTNIKLRDKIVLKEIVDGKEITKIVPYNEKTIQPETPYIEGYKFIGWYVGEKEFDFSRTITEDEIIEAKFELIDYKISYELNGGTVKENKETYNVETETFELNNPTKKGYNFAGWTEENSDTLQTKVTINKGTTGDKKYIANYSTKDNTQYKVIHKYENLDNTYDVEEETLTGVTDSKVTPQVKQKEEFNSPEPKTITINADGTSEVIYIYLRKKLELSYPDTTYINLENSTAPGVYKYGTPITVSAKNKEGYTFTKWNNNRTDISHTFNITENTEMIPEYSINAYTVTFDGNNGLTPTTITRNYETEVGELPTPNKDNYIFDAWYTTNNFEEKVTPTTIIRDNITFFANWKRSIYFMNIENTDVQITNKNTSQINILNPEEIGEEYTISSNDETIATVNETGLIEAESVGTTKVIITGTTTNLTKEINVTVNPRIYTVTFETDGGSNVDPIEINEGTTLETIPETEKTGFTLEGWFTESNEELTLETVINDSVTYIAHWSLSPELVCRRAKALHQQECIRTDSKGCKEDGYANGTLITFGNISNKEEYRPGDAFDCDVNGNGQIDKDANGNSIERFYYLRSINGTHAALIYYSNVVNGLDDNTVTQAYDASEKNYNVPTNVISNLPLKTSWSNISLMNNNVQVYNENHETINKGIELPIIDYSNYSSRIPVLEDIEEACSIDATSDNDEEALPTTAYNGCQFMFENTTYVNPNIKSGYWVTTVWSKNTTEVFRTVGSRHTIETNDVTASTGSGTRPVIEVPLSLIEPEFDNNTYTVFFDSQGGTIVDSKEVTKNGKIGTLPSNPTKSGYTFIGWYTDDTYEEEVTEDTIITENTIIYAKWLIENAVVEYNNTGYESVTVALSKVKNSNKAVLKLLKNTTEKVSIASGRDIELDLNGFTISQTEDKNTIENSGTLKVYNGNLDSTAGTNAVINNKSGGILYINNVNVTHNGDRSALYNYGGGKAYIDEGSILVSNNNKRSSIMNLENGELTVINATVKSDYLPAIDNKGTLTIGKEDGILNNASPLIQGNNSGIQTTTDFSFFDGVIKGTNAAVSGSVTITTEANYSKKEGEETIENIDYKTLYLESN